MQRQVPQLVLIYIYYSMFNLTILKHIVIYVDKLNSRVVGPGETPASRYLYLSLGEIEDIEGNPVEVAEAYKLSTMITGQMVGSILFLYRNLI